MRPARKSIPARAGVALLASAGALAAQADETALQLRDGPEAVVVRAYCSVCHSIDYIQMNSTFMKRAGWEAEVRKMVKVMGAPVPEDDVARIVDYLTRHYGTE
jgi:cytochrome c5